VAIFLDVQPLDNLASWCYNICIGITGVAMKRLALIAGFASILVLWLTLDRVRGHFQVLIPSTDVVSAKDDKTVNLDILFTHPMEQGPLMEMAAPKQFGMLVGGKKQDLAPQLKSRKIDGKSTFTAAVKVAAPGDYIFYIEPAPYWEAAEKKLIVHYTKVVVDVLGAEEGWDAMVGFPVEIQPLVRPYGLWAGNAFQGIVKKDGKPLPFAVVEVEYYNQDNRVKLPNDAFITQVVKADANGVFTYTMPKAGWWGFAALVESDRKLAGPDGKPAPVELGGLMWVKTVDMKERD
jgi:cobalt/nickel transport protein